MFINYILWVSTQKPATCGHTLMNKLLNKIGYFYDVNIQYFGYFYGDYTQVQMFIKNYNKTAWMYYYDYESKKVYHP